MRYESRREMPCTIYINTNTLYSYLLRTSTRNSYVPVMYLLRTSTLPPRTYQYSSAAHTLDVLVL